MKLLLVHPGASVATHDVFVGYQNALRERGHAVYPYQLDGRIEHAGSWLRHRWRRAGKPEPRPTTADILYLACTEALERALRFEVDGVLVISGMYFHPNVLTLMRRAGLKTGLVFTESPYDDAPQTTFAALTDVCWTNERSSLFLLRQANPRTYYLPPAYEPSRHSTAPYFGDAPAHDVVFVGTAFQERVDLLSAIDWTGIDLGLYGGWKVLNSRHRLRRYVKGFVVDNTYAASLYQRAKIGLNLYRQSIGFDRKAPRIRHAESLNPRAYELAACGVFQISDYRSEVTDVFGDSVPTFETPAQLGTLLRRYLPDADARRESAHRARQAVEPHTFAARAAQLEAQLAQAWASPLAKGA